MSTSVHGCPRTSTDELRMDLVPRLQTAIDTYGASEKALVDARNAEGRARDQLENATADWRDRMDKTFGTLSSRVGSDEAEGFYPRPKGRSSSQAPATSAASKPSDG